MTRSWNEGSGFHSLRPFLAPMAARSPEAALLTAAVLVWDEIATGEKLPHPRRHPVGQLRGLQPGRPPALRRMGYSGEVHLWDAGSGQEMLILRPFAPPPGTLGFTPRLAFSSDGSRIAANSAHGIITIWDAGADAVPAFRDLESPPAIESPDPRRLLKKRADLAMRSGRWDAAVADSSRLLERDPDDRAALLIRARANLALDNLEPAGSDLDRGLRLLPEDRQFLALSGEIHDREGRRLMEQEHPEEARKSWVRARSTYETLLRLGPDRAATAARLVDVLLRGRDLGDHWRSRNTGPGARSRVRHRASSVLNRPMSAAGEIALVYPKLPGWTRLAAAFALRGEWSAARDVLGKATADPSGASGEDRFLLAWVDHRLGRDEEARRSLDQAIGWMEEHESGGELGALALVVMPEVLGTSQADAARRITRAASEWPIERLSREIERQPNNLNSRYLRGEYLADRGDWSRAADDLAVAVEQVPDNAMFHYRLALARLFSGDRAGYRAAGAAAFDRFGATADPRVANRVLFACVFRPDAVDDLAALDRLARRAGASYPGGERIVGAAYCRAGRCEEALKQFDLAQRVLPPRAFELAFLAMCHARLGHDQIARQFLERANRWIDEADRAPTGCGAEHPSWTNSFEQYGSRLLLREAQELILDAGFPADPFVP